MKHTKSSYLFTRLLLLTVILFNITPLVTLPIYATENTVADETTLNTREQESSLTRIYKDSMMQGSWRMIKKMDFIVVVNQWVLSFTGLMSNCVVLYRLAITIFYKSGSSFWDTVHELKSSKGQGSYGMDAIVMRGMAFLIDIKQMSDFNSKSGIKLSESDDIWTYIIKSAPSTLGTLLISTIAYNGTLGRVWAVLVDGMAVVFENFEDINLASAVNTYINQERGFNFTYDLDGSYSGKFMQKCAVSLYNEIKRSAGAHKKEQFDAIGQKVTEYVGQDIKTLNQKYGLGFSEESEFAENSADGYNYKARDINEDCLSSYKIKVELINTTGTVMHKNLKGGAAFQLEGFSPKEFVPNATEEGKFYLFIGKE